MSDFQSQAELFASRLKKRARHFRRWPGRGIVCYRVYERDIPEIPLVVDRYDNCLHVTEYQRPHERQESEQQAWLNAMLLAVSEALDTPGERIYFKSRVKSATESGRASQYHKMDQRLAEFEVTENDLKFIVNLSDYVDTGLFLDHRITRAMVRERAEGKDFLNLFAYTGSFSVYAAAGKARSTTTIDLSRNYLDWAGRNFERNGLLGPNHHFIASDAVSYLNSIQANGGQFDLAVVDPPTHSNSKRLKKDWNVQSEYVGFLNSLSNVMRPGGEVYFSTNFRRFKFDANKLRYRSREISNQTVPEDFRNKKIHRCWWLKKPDQ